MFISCVIQVIIDNDSVFINISQHISSHYDLQSSTSFTHFVCSVRSCKRLFLRLKPLKGSSHHLLILSHSRSVVLVLPLLIPSIFIKRTLLSKETDSLYQTLSHLSRVLVRFVPAVRVDLPEQVLDAFVVELVPTAAVLVQLPHLTQQEIRNLQNSRSNAHQSNTQQQFPCRVEFN